MTTSIRPDSGSTRILVVEDTPEDALLLQTLIEGSKAGRFQTESVGRLSTALTRLAAGGIDAVVLDLTLPDSSGLETFEKMQKQFPTVPILVLTASANESMADLAIRHGAQDYLLKDRVDSALVVRAVRYAIERKRAENALRKSEERFEVMARVTNDAVWDLDIPTNRMWWNVGVRSFLGYPADTVGSDFNWWQDHIHPEDKERVISAVREVIEGGGRFWLDEYRFLCSDGSYACVFDRGHVLHDEQGKPLRMIGAMMDITDRKRAEEALRETNETLRTLIQASPLGIAVLDASEKVRIWNPAAERITGWRASDVLGQLIPGMSGGGRPDEFPALAQRALHGEAVTGAEIPGRRKGEIPIELSVSMAPLRDALGSISGAMAVLADISERKSAEIQKGQLEEQLRQSQKMEAVGRLAGGVAHDFNNLLTAISGYAELLQGRFEPGNDIRGYVDEILKSSGRATQLTRQLLAFSRRQVLQPKVLDLNSVVQNMDGLLRRLIGEHIELTASLDTRLASVRADQGQIEQVIMNLSVNARDAMPNGGRLIIETRNVDLDAGYNDRHGRLRTGPHVLLAVTDSGHGMDSETQSHLFEPFFTTKEQDKGTGLGLATVYGIVKQTGGDIWVYSEPGKGSVFKIYFPRIDEAPQRASKDEARSRARRGTETVLLAEDSDVVRRLLRELLISNGYTLLEARHGLEALEIARTFEGRIDLLVTDMVMPQMSGRELAAQLGPERPEMKILFMSGYTEDAIARHGVLDPGTAFLEKPFTPDSLAKKVRELLDHRVT
ncbi:MAG TPA: response regulator [Planctomycetota bacterium]|nr:response regulator [Planctomycetota bacterium]